MVRPRNLGRVGQGPANPVKDWLESLPPVTRVWFVASFGTTCLISLTCDPYRLLWSWPAVRHRFEVWRLITPYFFSGVLVFRSSSTYFAPAVFQGLRDQPLQHGRRRRHGGLYMDDVPRSINVVRRF